MRLEIHGRGLRAGFALLVFGLVAVLSPVRTIAQDPPQRWDGLIERLSAPGQWQPESFRNPRMSRHAVSADGRLFVFSAEFPNDPYPPSVYVVLRDRGAGDYGETRVWAVDAATPPVISSDGNHLAWESCNPAYRPDYQPICDIWTLDLRSNALQTMSVALDGTWSTANSTDPMLSATGRFIVFRTDSPTLLPPGAAPGQLVLRDRDTDADGIFDEPGESSITVVSVSSFGDIANAESSAAEVSADGQFVAFRSRATNLVENDTNDAWDVFFHEVQTGKTRRLNVGWDGQQATPTVDSPGISMSEDGRYVAFAGDDWYLLNPPTHLDDNNDALDVYVFDRVDDSLSRIDLGVDGAVGNGHTHWPSLSSDGRYVTVVSNATNVVNPGTQGRAHVFAYDRVTNQATRVSVGRDGVEPDRDCAYSTISGDGSLITFISRATNLPTGAPPDTDTIYAAVHFDVTPLSFTIPARGGNITATITAQRYAHWQVDFSDYQYWLQFASPPWGMGSGTVSFHADRNNDQTARTVNALLQWKTIAVTQEPGLWITSVTPLQGPATGGTTVTIAGTGFEPDMTAWFDGTPAPVEFVSTTLVRVVTPAHPAGNAWINFTTADYANAWYPQQFHFMDVTPPQIYAFADGTQGSDGWFISDVQIGFSVWDPDGPITSLEGCAYVYLTTDTAGTTYTCIATSEGGTSTASVFVKRDANGPVIDLVSPEPRLYKVNETPVAAYSCTDAFTGVAECTGDVPNGAPLDMMPGYHTFSVIARDAAGNWNSRNVDYAVESDTCAFRPEGMVAWFPFETLSGETPQPNYRDVISGADADPVNATQFAEGATGSFALSLANGSYVTAGTRSDLEQPFRFGLMAWVKPGAPGTDPQVIAGREGEYMLARFPDRTLRWAIGESGGGFTWVNTGYELPDNIWSHVALTFNGAGSYVTAYHNGRVVSQQFEPSALVDVRPDLDEFRIGARQLSGSPWYFTGVIDDVIVVNRQLFGSDVMPTYLAGSRGFCGPTNTTIAVTPNPLYAEVGVSVQRELVARLTSDIGVVIGRTVTFLDPSGTVLGTGVTDNNSEARFTTAVAPTTAGYQAGYQARFDGDLYFASSLGSALLAVERGHPQITWPAPAPIVYGTPLGAAQLNATANVQGTFAYVPPAGIELGVGTHTLRADFTPADSDNYTTATASVTIDVAKATPVVTVSGGSFTYDGNPHAATGTVTGVGGVSLGPLTFTYNGAPNPPIDAGTYTVVATYDGDANYTAASATGTLTIDKATPTVSVVGGTFTYDGNAHQASGSVTGVAGVSLGPLVFSYAGSPEAPVNAGSYEVVASYAGEANYNPASATATLTINKASATVSVTGGEFTYDGQPHAATGSVTGVGGANLGTPTFTYNGSPDVPVNAGSYGVVASFAGDANYDGASATATLTINKASATVSVVGGEFTYDGQPHAATGSVTGVGGANLGAPTFTYNGSPDAPVNAGSYDVVASYAGDANYDAASATATLTINKASATVSVTGGEFTYDGQPHAATGSVTGVGGVSLGTPTFTYNGSPDAPVNAGSYEVVASFAGDANYNAASATATITIGKATASLQWSQPASIVYGTPLGAAQLNATANTAGTFTYSPAAGTVLAAGNGHVLSVTFTPADPANYNGASASTTIDVAPAPLTVRADDASKRFGAPLPAFTATVTGLVNGDTVASLNGSIAFATTATAQSPVGSYPIVPSGVSSANYAITFVNGTLAIVRGAVTVNISTSPEPSGANQLMTFTASVAAASPAVGNPGGVVRFFDGTTLLGSASLAGGTATLSTAGLDPGTRTIEARYEGDGSFEPGTGSASHVIRDAANTPSIAITSSRNPANTGQNVTLTADVAVGGAPVSGSVQFYDGGTLLATAALSNGRATYTTAAFPAGSHAIAVWYLGNAAAPPVRSSVFVQAVGASGWKNRATTMSVSTSPDPASLGDTIVVTANVTGSSTAMPTGRILIMVNGDVAGDPIVVPVSGTTARITLSVAGLAHGRHTISATYLGDSTYKGSTAQSAVPVN